MRYQLAFEAYQRQFKQPLQTRYGAWSVREGVILSLTAETGVVGQGEIAPLPGFGSEDLASAIGYLNSLPWSLTTAKVFAVPATLPACQFGLETAWEDLQYRSQLEPKLPSAHLLPTGAPALTAWQIPYSQGIRTFKWKIGVVPVSDEQLWFDQLLAQWPADAQLRLDANGGLSLADAEQWLYACADRPVEYLEQPLPPADFDAMLALAQRFATPLALDESVANLADLQACYQRGWRGVYVIKPAIMGSPYWLRQFCQTHSIDAVFSTVFETPIGRRAGLRLAAELGSGRAVGYGTTHWFDEDDEP
jgi:o-succinylbenzoate synthase